MTKAELSREIAQETGLQIKEVIAVLDSFVHTVKSQVIKKESVVLRGFGTFKMRHRNEKIARNIAKGTEIVIPAKDVPSFKPSTQFFEI